MKFPLFDQRFIAQCQSHIQSFPGGLLTILPKNFKVNSLAKQASVLVPLCNFNGSPSILFTLRSSSVGTHKGQVSFPGGHKEPGESAVETARREFLEELFVARTSPPIDLTILGQCQTIPAITSTMVTPVIAFIQQPVDSLSLFHPSETEVEKVFVRSIDELARPGSKRMETRNRNGLEMTMPVWGSEDDPERIWGLTAIILQAVLEKSIVPTFKQIQN
jgi:8-oxo-dGTP pyrophosphatase MutT (NUDIX family)